MVMIGHIMVMIGHIMIMNEQQKNPLYSEISLRVLGGTACPRGGWEVSPLTAATIATDGAGRGVSGPAPAAIGGAEAGRARRG